MSSADTKAGPICILVTGAPHAGTRLMVDMLSQHPDIDIAAHALTPTKESRALHRFFVRTMWETPVYDENYHLDETELRFIMDAYLTQFDHTKPYIVIKSPYYPLNCLDFFVSYFEGRIKFVFTHRAAEKVVKSFVKRGEDKLYFEQSSEELFTQVKKLPVDRRAYYLATTNAQEFFAEVVEYSDKLRDDWNARRPEYHMVDVDMQQLVQSRAYVVNVLEQLGLDTGAVDQMMSVVDSDRLLQRTPKNQAGIWQRPKAVLRAVTPPVLWRLAQRIKTVVTGS